MKPRTDTVQKALDTLLATSMRGQLHAGDSMGVWTFGQDLRMGDYPLQSWNPDSAAMIASNLTRFVQGQHYAKSARYEVLQPMLNRVVQDSQRLTVLIFCDGNGKITGTPYDAAINQIFTNKVAEQKKAGEPLVVLLRSQLGEYVACTVTLSPQMVNIPPFPPLPEPPAPPAPKPVIAPPPPAPVVMAPPLIIIGKKPAPSVPLPVTNPPPVMQTNPPVPATNPVAAKIIVVAPTNVPVQPAALPKTLDAGDKSFQVVGAGLFGAAIALGLVLFLRPRRKDASLITRSMNDPK
jgi:hypothetical protein